jgi:hypothetical protein
LRILDIADGEAIVSKSFLRASKFDEILETFTDRLGINSEKFKTHKRDSMSSKSNVLRYS